MEKSVPTGPLYSGVFWDAQLVPLEDIDRIEAVRGPGSTLWGSNAVNGVINVVTRSAANSQGLAIATWTGLEERGGLSARYGGRLSETTLYRTYVRASSRDDARLADGSGSEDEWRGAIAGFRLDRSKAGVDATVQGDVYQAREGLRGRGDIEMSGGHVLGLVRRPMAGGSLQAVAYFDRTVRRVPLQLGEVRHTADLDGQYSRPLAGRHAVLVGGGRLQAYWFDTVLLPSSA